MKKFVLCILIFLSILARAQNTLSGVVMSHKDHLPVVFASVYVSGTTKGTYTDSKGRFTLPDVTTPCQLVVSHIAYDLQLIPIEKATVLTLYVTGKAKQLTGVSVSGSSRRKLNVRDFKDTFMGNDYWGRNAFMKNDSVLIFSRDPDTLMRKANAMDFEMKQMNVSLPDNNQWSADSTHILMLEPTFEARTNSPLLIDIPLLGYQVYVDLVIFSLKKNIMWADCSYRAYYHFIADTVVSARQQAKINKNRQDVYYNSSNHFCKALFDHNLEENGYLISFKNDFNDYSPPAKRYYEDLSQFVKYVSPSEVKVTGLKNKKLSIYYFCKSNGKPVNLTLKNKKTGSPDIEWALCSREDNSYVQFKSDTCIIRSNGTSPDTNIRFSGKIASKRGGALLPVEYLP